MLHSGKETCVVLFSQSFQKALIKSKIKSMIENEKVNCVLLFLCYVLSLDHRGGREGGRDGPVTSGEARRAPLGDLCPFIS